MAAFGWARRSLLALLLPFVALSLATPALAHALAVRSRPDPDARLAQPPAEVRVSFSEAVVARFSEIQVLDPAARRVDRADLGAVDELTLRVSLASLGEGGYTVVWRVLSAVDGHETRGSFTFAVGNAPLPSLPDPGGAPAPSPLELLGRALSFIGLALLIGVPVFALAVARSEWDGSTTHTLVRTGALALLAGAALLAIAQPMPLELLLDSRLGRLFAGRALVGLGVLATRPGPRRTLAFAALAAVSLTAQSHAAASGGPLEIAPDLAHLVAGSVWAGGLATLALTALAGRRAQDSRALGSLVGRFSMLGIASVAVIIGTGTLQAFRRLADVRDLLETPYGLALLAKIALLALALAFAALNLLRHGPDLRADRAAARARRLLTLGVRGEVAAVAGILAAASVLTALVPANTPVGAGFSAVAHSGACASSSPHRRSCPGRTATSCVSRGARASPGDREGRVALHDGRARQGRAGARRA